MLMGAIPLLMMGLLYWYTRRSFRGLPESVAAEIRALPERGANQHLVDLELADGRIIKKVYVAWQRFPSVSPRRWLVHRYRPSAVVHARQHNPAGQAARLVTSAARQEHQELAVARPANAWAEAQHGFRSDYLANGASPKRTLVHWRRVGVSNIVVWHSDLPAGTPAELSFDVQAAPAQPEGDGMLLGEFATNGALCLDVAAGSVLWPTYNPQPPQRTVIR
jgi:hypothetical protein